MPLIAIIPIGAFVILFPPLRIFILLPLRRYKTDVPILMYPKFTQIDPTDLPEPFRATFEETARSLVALNFSAAMHARKQSANQNIETYHSAWVCPEHGCSAHLYLGRIIASSNGRQSCDLLFVNEFDDGTCVFTTNQSLPTLAQDRNWRIVHWPEMRNLSLLFDFHLKRVASYRGRCQSLLVSKDRMNEHARQWHNRAMDLSVNAGFYWSDNQDGVYRLTLRGAFVTTCRMVWPLGPFRRRMESARLRAELAAVGMPTRRSSSSLSKEPGFPITPA